MEERLYKSPILEKMREEMSKDKWHVKLKRWASLQYWLFYCLVFNNKFIRKWKIKDTITTLQADD